MYFWIHDPNFFILVANQDVIPFAKVLMKPNGIKALWVMIRPVFYVNMDREGSLTILNYYWLSHKTS